MLAEGSLVQFGDTTMLLSAAWLPVQLWLTLVAARRPGFTAWDGAWAAVLALRVLSFHPQYGAYYEVLVVLFTLRRGVGPPAAHAAARAAPALRGRRASCSRPRSCPGTRTTLESGRRHIAEYADWHMRRAYLWWNYGLRWSDSRTSAFVPWLAWIAIVAAAFVGRLAGTRLWPVFGAYLVFALFHAVPYLAAPMWLTGKRAIFRSAFPSASSSPSCGSASCSSPSSSSGEARRRRRLALAALLVIALGACAWQTQFDPRAAYVVCRGGRGRCPPGSRPRSGPSRRPTWRCSPARRRWPTSTSPS